MNPAEAALAELIPFFRSHFGNRLDKVILFGSYARGDFHEESDLDLLVVLDEPEVSRFRERRAILSELGKCHLTHGIFPSVLFRTSSDFAQSKSPLFTSIRTEGVILYERVSESLLA